MKMLRWAHGATKMEKNREWDYPEHDEGHRDRQESAGEKIRLVPACDDEEWKSCQKEGVGNGSGRQKVKKGRPCRRWTDCVQEDLKEKGIRKQHTEDRNKWKRLIRNGDLVWHGKSPGRRRLIFFLVYYIILDYNKWTEADKCLMWGSLGRMLHKKEGGFNSSVKSHYIGVRRSKLTFLFLPYPFE